MQRLSIAALFIAASLGAAMAGPGAPGHHKAGFSAGQPGDPKKPARAVEITMGERDGKMFFNHDYVEVKRGEHIRFILKNIGELDHEFVLATAKENLKHAEEMRKNPDMEHDDPNAKKVPIKKNGEILWRFNKRGTFQFACLIHGHLESGMHGTVIVK